MANNQPAAVRRKVHYDSLNGLLLDARRCAEVETVMAGDWSLGQVLKHLAASTRASVVGFGFSAPWPMRFVMKNVMKRRLLSKTLPSGFKIPKKVEGTMLPDDMISTAEALNALEQAIQEFNEAPTHVVHPFLGELSNEEWVQFHLRHAELHMSFAVPRDG